MRKLYLIVLLLISVSGFSQTAVPMASQPGLTYTENFADIANWTNNFAAGIGASRWGSVAINATGTIGDGVRITTSTATFSTGTTGGVQRGTGVIQMLSTSTANSCAIDFYVDFTGVNAGNISFDVTTVNNSTGDRDSKLKLFYTTDGTNFIEITGTNLPYTARNNVAGNASINVALPSAINNTSVRFRFYEHSTTTGATPTGSQPKISIDNVTVTATNVAATPPTKLAVTSITPSSPIINSGFAVTVQSQDNSNAPQNVTSNTTVTLTVATGTGTLGGTVSGVINSGSNSVTITGVTYNVAESGVVLTASATSGMTLTAGNSSAFTVLAVASQLALVGVPSSGTVNSNLSSFTVEARRPDNTVDISYLGNITVAKASGPGNLTGTTVVGASSGVATFSNLQFDQAGTYTLSVSAAGLAGATSGNIVISAVQPFATGNLVVYRVGDGASALNSSATAVFLDEYTTAGTLVRSIALPVAAAGANKRMTAAGTGTSEGLITRSSNKQYLLFTGYDAAVGTSNINSTTSASVNRVVGRMSNSTSLDATTALTDFASANSVRGAVSTDGSAFWLSGAAGGVRYAALGATTSTQLSNDITNARSVNIFNGQLYVSSQTGAFRLSTVGTGLPTSNGQTITNLPGFPTASLSPYNYFFTDLDATVVGVDVVYVADDGADGGTPGFRKFSLVGGNWAANGNITVTGGALRGLTASVSGTTVTLYGTNPTSMFSLVDATGYNNTLVASPTTIATAGTNTAFRGIAFAPEDISGGSLPVSFTNFKATQKANGIQLDWTNETEEEIDVYVIERSSNGRTFNAIGEKAPLKNDNSKVSYSYFDAAPNNGDNYYRIKAVELSGKEVYTKIIRINPSSKTTDVVIYPNPVRGTDLNLMLSNLSAGKYEISVYNTNGQEVASKTITHAGGAVTESVSVGHLKAGIYTVRISGNIQLQKQFVVE